MVKASSVILKERVKSAADGDQISWYGLYREFHPSMYARALRICRDNEKAADAVQDAFVTAYLKLFQLKDPNMFGAWLKQIVTHTCFRSLSSSCKPVSLDAVSLESDSFRDNALTEKAEQLAAQSKLHRALAHLPHTLSSTVMLRYFSDFNTYDEIAAVLHVPIGTVRSRLNEAKKKLTAYWRQHRDASDVMFRESEEWNAFYTSTYGGMHEHDTCKNKFISHTGESNIVFPNGKHDKGGDSIDRMVAEDRQVGSWLAPVNIISSGSVSIIESRHFNSRDHPQHCPAGSVIVLIRTGGKASQLFVHTSEK